MITSFCRSRCSSSETVESSTLSLEGIDDVKSGDGLSLGVLSVGDSDDVLEEASEDLPFLCGLVP